MPLSPCARNFWTACASSGTAPCGLPGSIAYPASLSCEAERPSAGGAALDVDVVCGLAAAVGAGGGAGGCLVVAAGALGVVWVLAFAFDDDAGRVALAAVVWAPVVPCEAPSLLPLSPISAAAEPPPRQTAARPASIQAPRCGWRLRATGSRGGAGLRSRGGRA